MFHNFHNTIAKNRPVVMVLHGILMEAPPHLPLASEDLRYRVGGHMVVSSHSGIPM